eukprot:8244915-Pyramimonas_sp.AAC.1
MLTSACLVKFCPVLSRSLVRSSMPRAASQPGVRYLAQQAERPGQRKPLRRAHDGDALARVWPEQPDRDNKVRVKVKRVNHTGLGLSEEPGDHGEIDDATRRPARGLRGGRDDCLGRL